MNIFGSASRRYPPARLVVLPLAVLIAAAALTAGSGMDFRSSSEVTTQSATSGALSSSNGRANSAIFSLGNLKPGDSLTGSAVIANSGWLAERGTNGLVKKDNLSLTIAVATAPTTPIWAGTFGELTREGPLSLRGDGTPREYIFTVTLASSADNTEQGSTASASYQWFGADSTAGRNQAPAR
ncbi:hypothetical protein FB472_2247 [Rhodoglobus vestalii]|uniref:Camelysin-like metallo-endopeptidase n=1 Tax=Rhodoglobus vestalii TaxID=193384 RepID=A0A8H2K819_9MICO|nr:hypothetical protein [Rhodoglobus vestalii]TQO20609.1 hypothetical protein FB472_2247 [Rhodoglobus vestalii]